MQRVAPVFAGDAEFQEPAFGDTAGTYAGEGAVGGSEAVGGRYKVAS